MKNGKKKRGILSLHTLATLAVAALSTMIVGCAGLGESTKISLTESDLAGADISALPIYEKNGTVYRYSDGTPGDAIAILRAEGMDAFRLRLFVNPSGDDVEVNDADYTLSLAKRIKASGAKLVLDLHYSDTWADPDKQGKPAAWKNLSFEELKRKVEYYTRETLLRFISEDASPDYVQLGNEVTNGMLWPDGHIEFAEKDNTAAFDRFAELQQAARKGFDEAFEGRSAPVVILHIESTGNIPRTEWFIENAAARGIRYDILAFSYYPNWHGTIAQLKQTLDFAAAKSGKPVMVAETSTPWKRTADWNRYPRTLEYPQTIKGQKAFAEAMAKTIRKVPEGRGTGIFWWCPEAVLNKDMGVWLGGDCALFDNDGTILPTARSLCGK